MSNFRTTENSYRGRDIWREVLWPSDDDGDDEDDDDGDDDDDDDSQDGQVVRPFWE